MNRLKPLRHAVTEFFPGDSPDPGKRGIGIHDRLTVRREIRDPKCRTYGLCELLESSFALAQRLLSTMTLGHITFYPDITDRSILDISHGKYGEVQRNSRSTAGAAVHLSSIAAGRRQCAHHVSECLIADMNRRGLALQFICGVAEDPLMGSILQEILTLRINGHDTVYGVCEDFLVQPQLFLRSFPLCNIGGNEAQGGQTT